VALDFWALESRGEEVAVVCDDGRTLSFKDLANSADRFVEHLNVSAKTFGFILCRNALPSLVAYLGALRSGNCACLLDAEIDSDLLSSLVRRYSPDWIFSSDPVPLSEYTQAQLEEGYLFKPRIAGDLRPLNPNLALLLPTSGSTGSPKLVRLSYENLRANASSIAEYLGIGARDRAITSLPFAYSYGLSVVNSHLGAGGRLLLTRHAFLQRDFWNFCKQEETTSFAGVPYHYDSLLRMRLLDKPPSSIRVLTQAGGRLSPESIARVANLSRTHDWRFYVMYGQTEATARMSFVPPEHLLEKIGSVGVAIPGGRFFVDAETQELLYEGPNVMFGYADSAADLQKGDELRGRLRTGDLCRIDSDGFVYLTGRLKRFLKIFGRRISLDEIEQVISSRLGCEAACYGSDDHLVVAVDVSSTQSKVTRLLMDVFKLHSSAFTVLALESLPRLSNGKQDYKALAAMAATR
jgi:long-chain acyl-CoA synthetase